MKRISMLLIVLIFAGNVLAADSQNQTPTKEKSPAQQPNKSNESTTAYQPYTKESPLFIQELPTQEAQEKAESRRQDSKREENAQQFSLWIAIVQDAITGILVIITWCLAKYTYKLWRSTDDLVKGSDESAKRQTRAYVVVESGVIFNVIDPLPPIEKVIPNNPDQPLAHITHPNEPPLVKLQIRNTGKSPASKIAHWGIMEVGGYPLTTNLSPKDDNIKPMYSVLGTFIPSTKILKLKAPLTPEEANEIRNGTKAIYIHGEIRYMDIFGEKERFTKYRVMYQASFGVIGRTTDLYFCEGGNEADWDN